MAELKELFQAADWKKEKHVPVIDAPDKCKKGEWVKASLAVGKEIAHPNTTEHHIRWIALFFLPDGEKFPYQIGRFEFDAHGESAAGPNMSTVYTHPEGIAVFKTDKPGMILVSSYCNIHGLWQSSKKLEVA
ncbi:MAG: class II SORL domain-containing protein [Candidatus Omnitrophota bacterium]|nr:class II SORL domain-containing protein [Candidatus Omnitrophota bacterium]